MNELEQKAWTSGMTVMEKLTAIKKYIYDNYTYTTDGVMCNAGAQALLYAARDLGLTARYRFVSPQYDYEKGYGDVYYHFLALHFAEGMCARSSQWLQRLYYGNPGTRGLKRGSHDEESWELL